MADPKKRLAEIEKRLRAANSSVAQIQGRLDSAKENLAEVEKECRERKIDPDRIDEVITALESRFDQQASELENDIARTEKELAPFLGETT